MEARVNSVWTLLQELESKKGISEILINDGKHVFVEKEGEFIQLNAPLNKDHIYEFIRDVAAYNKKHCNEDHPILDGTLPDGSRVNIIIEPFAYSCPAISIRKYLKHIKNFDHDPLIFGLGDKWIQFLKAMVASRRNFLVSGGTGVGKTTLLNLLLQEIAPQERVVSIEDTLELTINLPNQVRLETRSLSATSGMHLRVRDLVKNALRMRPDRLIIGEVRGEELFDLLLAMNTGHDGSMTSVHANSARDTLSRLEGLYLMAGYELPLVAIRKQICQALDFVIHLSRNKEGKRVIGEIFELTEMEGDTILCQSVAKRVDERLQSTGIVPKCVDALKERGGLPPQFFA